MILFLRISQIYKSHKINSHKTLQFHAFLAKVPQFFTVWTPSGFFQFFILRVLLRDLRIATGTACLIVLLVSFARLTLPIMRDNTGNRLSRFRSRALIIVLFRKRTFPNAATSFERIYVYIYEYIYICIDVSMVRRLSTV